MSTAWTASTAVVAGAVFEPTVVTGNGLVFRATNAGTTGTTQPIWPTTFGGTVTDGTVTWRAVSQVTGEFQSLQPSSIIELFELQLTAALHGSNDVYRFHAGANANNNGDVVWAGNTYQRFPIEADGFEYGGQGQLPRPKVRVSNVFGTITAVLATLPSGLERAKVTRIRTLARYLDNVNFPSSNPFGMPDPSAEFPREIYYIDRKTTENRDVIEFELAAAFDLQGVRAPKRQCVANICPWVYRSAECGYTEANYWTAADQPTANSALDACGKRLSSCELRFTRIPRTGSTVFGSTTLTLDSTASLIPGMPASGPGITSGSTIVSVNTATTLTMSAAATVTTSQTKTGTVSATTAAMTVTDATGLTTGMTVTGAYVPSGTTITAIAGTTLTLNQRPYSLKITGTYRNVQGQQWIGTNAAGLSVGMRVFGANNVNTTISSIDTNLYGQYIYLSEYGDLPGYAIEFPVTLFVIPAAPTASTYQIVFPDPVFYFRSADSALPFGGFPGIGAYYT